ncbi:MAG: HlyD family efflux transporter periplasmic adaptor subunit [Planctomycetes bacterium]|nr:HlyD family efflux transporter periplasmic adaptor subunit [Planctomycetota bacterium]
MKWVKRGALILIGVLIVGGIVYGFMPKPIASEFARASRGDIRVTIDEEGFTRVKDRFTVRAPLPGNIERINLKPGDDVEAGSLIATLTPSEPMLLDARTKAQHTANVKAAQAGVSQAEANRERAQAELDLAVKEHKRLEGLLKGSHVSQEAVDAAATKELAAQAALNSAKFGEQAAAFQLVMAESALIERNEGAKLQAMEIRSPVSGQVLRVYRDSEGPVQTGEMLVEIGDPRSLEIVVDLLSSDAVRVKPDMKVSIERWGGEDALAGHVRRVEPSGFTKVSSLGVEEQRVNVIIDFDGNPEVWSKLGDQYRVESRVIIRERKGVVKVPIGALFNVPEGSALFVVTGGKAEQRVVETGERNGLEAEVLGALNEGDTVIVHPSDEIKNGTSVQSR